MATTMDICNKDNPRTSPFGLIPEELLLQVASYLPAQDLLQFQCVSTKTNRLNTDAIWKDLCEKRWKSWPRYSLTTERLEELDKRMPDTCWKTRYLVVEKDATRSELQPSDLHNLRWYLSFVLSGIRGEGRSDHMEVHFTPGQVLLVPGHPPLPYKIVRGQPPSSPRSIRANLRGDQPFSSIHWLQISDFPAHFVTRKRSDAEWLIVNENVIMVSCKKD